MKSRTSVHSLSFWVYFQWPLFSGKSGVWSLHTFKIPWAGRDKEKNQPIQNDICKGTHGTLLLLYKELAGKIVTFFGACRFKFYYEEKLFLV